jgi:hypothetical protein
MRDDEEYGNGRKCFLTKRTVLLHDWIADTAEIVPGKAVNTDWS